uniref:Uncharacterized protein n=1 Tax=Arundo donax TaxID=35708 RepID=A0A0A8YVT5_ARUDO
MGFQLHLHSVFRRLRQ